MCIRDRDKEKLLDGAAIDRYAFIRNAYKQQRQSLVYDGDPPREKFDDEFDEEFDDEANSDIPDTTSIENVPPVVIGTAVPQSSMEPLSQETSSNPASIEQPTEIVVPAESAFNPYRMQELVPAKSENSLQN